MTVIYSPILIAERRSTVRFELATAAHDEGLRRLLRENPMRGRISVSLEREPSYFAADEIDGSSHRTIVALKVGRVVCAGSVSVRRRYINGQSTKVGYLGGLRLDHSCRGRVAIVRRGYEFFRELHEQEGADLYLTSIVADNQPARRLLERGLKGMPTYRLLGEFVTLVLPVRRRRGATPVASIVQASADSLPQVLDLLELRQREYQFAPVWTIDDFNVCPHGAGVTINDFRLIMPSGAASSAGVAPKACAALWDQRAVKQTVVRGYSPLLRRARPLLNAAGALLGRPRLPQVGQALSHAFVSHMATDPADPGAACALIQGLLAVAQSRGIDYLTVGFDSRDPRLAQLRKQGRHREYVSRLYCVHWEDGKKRAASVDGRLLAPEVALL